MLDHIAIQCVNLHASSAFYDAALGTLGYRRIMDFDSAIGYGREFPSFWIAPHDSGIGFSEAHIAFRAPSRDAVDAFREAAVALNAEVLHEPRLWPEYHAGYYAAFVRDPDGTNIEAVHHTFA